MNFTTTPFLCKYCSRPYEGFGCDSKEALGETKLICEGCGNPEWFLFSFRVPEKDIRFIFKCNYRFSTEYAVKVNGRLLYPSGVMTAQIEPRKLEYKTQEPGVTDLASAIKNFYNVHDEEDFFLNISGWWNTIRWEYDSERLTDDLFEAFKIFTGKDDIRRAVYLCDDTGEKDESGFTVWTNKRIEYY